VFRHGLSRRGWWRNSLWRHSGHDQNATARFRWPRQGRQLRGAGVSRPAHQRRARSRVRGPGRALARQVFTGGALPGPVGPW